MYAFTNEKALSVDKAFSDKDMVTETPGDPARRLLAASLPRKTFKSNKITCSLRDQLLRIAKRHYGSWNCQIRLVKVSYICYLLIFFFR